MGRRIVVTVPQRARPSCPFVHHKGEGKPACQTCHRAYTPAEVREFREACNGDEKCDEGLHVARICEGCVHREEQQEAVS